MPMPASDFERFKEEGREFESLLHELHTDKKPIFWLSDLLTLVAKDRRGRKLKSAAKSDGSQLSHHVLRKLWAQFGIEVVPVLLNESQYLHQGTMTTARGSLKTLIPWNLGLSEAGMPASVSEAGMSASGSHESAGGLPVFVFRAVDDYTKREYHLIRFFVFRWNEPSVKWYNHEGTLVVSTNITESSDRVFLLHQLELGALHQEEKNLFQVCICDRNGSLFKCLRLHQMFHLTTIKKPMDFEETAGKVFENQRFVLDVNYEFGDKYVELLVQSLTPYISKVNAQYTKEHVQEFMVELLKVMVLEKQRKQTLVEQLESMAVILNKDLIKSSFLEIMHALLECGQDCIEASNFVAGTIDMITGALSLQMLQKTMIKYKSKKKRSANHPYKAGYMIHDNLIQTFHELLNLVSLSCSDEVWHWIIPSKIREHSYSLWEQLPLIPIIHFNETIERIDMDYITEFYRDICENGFAHVSICSKKLRQLWCQYHKVVDSDAAIPANWLLEYSRKLNKLWYNVRTELMLRSFDLDKRDKNLQLLQKIFVGMILKNCVKNVTASSANCGQAVCLLIQTAYMPTELRSLLPDMTGFSDQMFLLEVTFLELNYGLSGVLSLRFVCGDTDVSINSPKESIVSLPSDGMVLLPVTVADLLENIKRYTVHSSPEKHAIALYVAEVLDDLKLKHTNWDNSTVGSFWKDKLCEFITMLNMDEIWVLMECLEIEKESPLDNGSFLYMFNGTQTNLSPKMFLVEQIINLLKHKGTDVSQITRQVNALNAAYGTGQVQDDTEGGHNTVFFEFKIYMQFIFVLMTVSYSLKLEPTNDQLWPVALKDQTTLQFLPGKNADPLYEACLKVIKSLIHKEPNNALSKPRVKMNIQKLMGLH